MSSKTKNVYQFLDISRIEPNKISVHKRKSEFVEIYQPFSEHEMQSQSGRCLDCGNPYCEWKCPVHNYIPQWLKLAEAGKIIEAAELSHQTNSLPEVCGRVCPQDRLCEGSCTLNDGFGAVTIGNIEKYITEQAFALGWKPNFKAKVSLNKTVAVIGAGPAGLACADFLTRYGFNVEVFDRHPEIGGLLTFGIPAFKLEKEIMHRRFELFKEMGVKFHLNTEIGKDVEFSQLVNSFSAVFIATGAYQPLQDENIDIKATGVYDALPFLIGNARSLLGYAHDIPLTDFRDKNVLVLGGGDTSMDCVRTLIRIGAKSVTGVYRRDEVNLPGSYKEYQNAGEEGVNFIFNAQPIGLSSADGKLSGVNFVKTKLVKSDTPGRFKPEIISDSNFNLNADMVITAFGFKVHDMPWLSAAQVDVDNQNKIKIDQNQHKFQTSNPKIFAGGDSVRGANLVVNAISDGIGAALAIKQYLIST